MFPWLGNGVRPVRHQNSVQPRPNISARASTELASRICSGAMKPTVPRTAPGSAEVEQLRLTFGRDQNVGRFDVAVNELVLVRLHKRTGHLIGEVAGLGGRQQSMRFNVFFQVLSRN